MRGEAKTFIFAGLIYDKMTPLRTSVFVRALIS